MTTTSLIPAKVETAIKPKPTKTEILEAFARHLFNRDTATFTKQAQKLNAEISAIENEINLIMVWFADQTTLETGWAKTGRNHRDERVFYRKVQLDVPRPLRRKYEQARTAIQEHKRTRWWGWREDIYTHDARREALRRAREILGSPTADRDRRIQLLAGDASVAKAFDRILAASRKQSERSAAINLAAS